MLVINANSVHLLSSRVGPSCGDGDRPAILGEHQGSDLNQFAGLHTGGDQRVRIGSRVAPCVDVGAARHRMGLPIVDVRVDRLC